MKSLVYLVPLVLLAACSKEPAKEGPDGEEKYALHCAGCHDPGPDHPGTMLLDQLGRPVPSLIGRESLDRDYVHSVVRYGLVEMPPFRPTELTDQDIDEIYDHIRQAQLPE